MLWFAAGLLLLTSLACNAFAGNSVTPGPQIPTLEAAVATAVPEVPPSTATPATLTVLVDLNVRAGPGVGYERLSYLPQGATAVIIGRAPEGEWLEIACPADVQSGECWVAGGPQYVETVGVDLVEAVPVPATPTASAPLDGAAGSRLAYAAEGQLFIAGLDLGGDLPVLATSPLQLTNGANVSDFAFAPDGQTLAYLSTTEDGNSLQTVSLDGREPRLLVSSEMLPLAAGGDADAAAVFIDKMQWLPDSRTIAFNTITVNRAGPGIQSQEDLWTVTLDSDLREVFTPGTGGGSFAVLDAQQALLSRADTILYADLAAASTETLLTFPTINTASESVYYPEVQVTEKGVFVAIPAADPGQDGALTTLWQLPLGKPPAELRQIANVPLDAPVVWSDAADRTGFIQQPSSGGPQLSRLLLADGAGMSAEPYTGGEGLRFFAWSPDSLTFLYAGDGFYATGRDDAPAQQSVLPAGHQAGTAVWLSADDFIISTGSAAAGEWQIKAASRTGASNTLVTIKGEDAPFAVWLAP
jgi:hypothetical protein